MQLIRELENFNPFRAKPGKLPLSYLARNMVFDTVFYDVGGLTWAEHADLVQRMVDFDEGGMLVVSPGGAERRIEYFALSHDLVAAHPDLDAVAIAGVGSSPLGTAALARQVADRHGAKVVGVISGYGAADVVSEALGGWLDFGTRNRVRAVLEEVRSLGAGDRRALSTADAKEEYKVLSDYLLVDEPESNTLVNLLLRQGTALRLLVGHSKGALNIQNAAHGFEIDPRSPDTSIERLRVATFGCGITLPARFTHLDQFVGTYDGLGRLNTPARVTRHDDFHWIEGRAHNLNERNPFHTPVDDLLAREQAPA